MPEMDDQEILRRMKQLSQVRPSPQAADRAMMLARRAVLSAGQTHERTRKRNLLLGRIFAPVGIAAAVLIVLFVIRQPAPPPSVHGTIAMSDADIRRTVQREALATQLIASTRILAEAPGSQEDVRKMCRFVVSQYGDTSAARALGNLNLSK